MGLNRHQKRARKSVERREEHRALAQNKPAWLTPPATKEEREALEQRADELGIKSGRYSKLQLVQYGNSIAGKRDQLWAENIESELIMSLFSSVLGLETIIAEIRGILKDNPNKKLWSLSESGKRLYPISDSQFSDMTKYYSELRLIAERHEMLPTDFPNRTGIIGGVFTLLSGKDDGEALRNAMWDYRPFSPGEWSWHARREKSGPKSSVVDRLCMKADVLRQAGLSWEEVANQMLHDYEIEDQHEENDEYKKLLKWLQKGNDIDNLSRNYSNWKKKRGEIEPIDRKN